MSPAAIEQSALWSLSFEECDAVDSAIRKAGWTGRISEDLRRAVKVRRYQSRHCAVTWDEYARWRAERGGA